MLEPTVLGPATTPGQLYHSRLAHDPGASDPSSSSSTCHRSSAPHHSAPNRDDGLEELAWFSSTVLWSRSSQIYRKYTYPEAVHHALFAHLPTGHRHQTKTKNNSLIATSGSTPVDTADGKRDETFGPFHTSQTASWGTPRPKSSGAGSEGKAGGVERTLVVFLEKCAHVYRASGEDVLIDLPFAVEKAWALPVASPFDLHPGAPSAPSNVPPGLALGPPLGGIMVQRALEKRELRKMDKGKGVLRDMDTSMGNVSAIDEIADLEEDVELPRLYTLGRPFEQFKPVLEGRVEGGHEGIGGRLLGGGVGLGVGATVLHVSRGAYPFLLYFDRESREVVFCRRVRVSLAPDAPPTTARNMRPEELLRQSEPPLHPRRPQRPSLHRNASSFNQADRRLSGAADPLDRTNRRAPRLSRGLAELPNTSTGELAAVLDPPPFTGAAMSAPTKPAGPVTRARGVSAAGPPPVQAAENRRQSGASSFMRQELNDPLGRDPVRSGPALYGAADLRETTMMMGLEREEVERSEVMLDRLWLWKPPEPFEPESISVFLSDDVTPSSVVINIHISSPGGGGTHYTFQAQYFHSQQRLSITPYKAVPCLSAIPIRSTRHDVFDTLILGKEGEITLVTSDSRLIPLVIPNTLLDNRDDVARNFASSLSMRLDEDDSMGISRLNERRIVGLTDGVGSSFTMVFDDGEQYRLSADFTIKSSLPRKCFEAISYVLPAQAFFDFKRELLLRQSSKKTPGDREWEVFVDTVKLMLGLPLAVPPATPFEALLGDAEGAPDAITRRLAAKVRHRRHESVTILRTEHTLGGATLQANDAAPLLLALHLVAQDCRLSSTTARDLLLVGGLVLDLSVAVGRRDWSDYWTRKLPLSRGNQTAKLPACDTSLLDRFAEPPDILHYLARRLVNPTKPFASPRCCLGVPASSELGSVKPCRQTELVCEIYDHLGVQTGGRLSNQDVIARSSAAVLFMVQEELTPEWLAALPSGLAIPIHEMIKVCQNNPGKNWSPDVYAIIGRTDLATQALAGEVVSRDDSRLDLDVGDMPTVGDLMATVDDSSAQSKVFQPSLPHVRFGSDRRVAEVERIMQTSRVRTIAVEDPKGASEQEVINYHQSVVNTIANRTLAITVGRGIFDFGTRTTTITGMWDIPIIELSVKISPGNAILQAQIAAESADWPCFNNGVAGGLSISPECKDIDSSWIVFNRPNTLNPEHGGFLLGLGLTGHLRSLLAYHAYPYMEPRHDFTSVGLLLGLACSYAGSGDLLLTKILSLHTHALLPMGSMELNASPVIQSSALVGLGLVFVGSKNLRMAEVALGEVGRKEMPGVDGFVEHQEAYSFSAATAFGLIMLGRGGQATSEVDRRMLAQLKRCISGDSPSLDIARSKASSTGVDTTVTAAGATLALGLVYLKTSRQDVADMLLIPQSAFTLEHVRPDLLLLRTFARSLIMWDEMSPTLDWIENQFPPFIQAAHKNHKRLSGMEMQTELAYFNIVAGACLAIGLKYAGTAAELAHNNILFFFGVLGKAAFGQSMTYEGRIRRTAARQALNMVTIALSVVMSGTGELNVLRRLRVSHGQEGAGVTYGTHMATHMACGILFLGRGTYTLGTSNLAIAAMSIAFFPRFLPSPGDNKAYPQAFRHLWALAVEPRCLMARDVETRETVYLPVKVRLRETGNIRTQNLISPTLISPFESLVSIEVDSPRYWPIAYDLSNPRDWDSLVRTRTIYVQRKAGFLDYNTDPKGNRSIFVRAGSMAGIELQYDLISGAAPPPLPAGDVKSLIKSHASSKALMAFASVFCGEKRTDAFVRNVLLECVSLDKTPLLSVYMEMYLALNGRRETILETMAQLALIRHFYSPAVFEGYNLVSTTGEKKATLIRQNFIHTVSRTLGDVDTIEGLEVAKKQYFEDGDWGGDPVELAVYLSKNGVPPSKLLAALKELVRGRKGRGEVEGGKEVLGLRVRDTARRYSEGVQGEFDQEMGRKGINVSGMEGWKAESVLEVLSLWLA